MSTAMQLAKAAAQRPSGSVNVGAGAVNLRKLTAATVAPSAAPTGPQPRF